MITIPDPQGTPTFQHSDPKYKYLLHIKTWTWILAAICIVGCVSGIMGPGIQIRLPGIYSKQTHFIREWYKDTLWQNGTNGTEGNWTTVEKVRRVPHTDVGLSIYGVTVTITYSRSIYLISGTLWVLVVLGLLLKHHGWFIPMLIQNVFSIIVLTLVFIIGCIIYGIYKEDIKVWVADKFLETTNATAYGYKEHHMREWMADYTENRFPGFVVFTLISIAVEIIAFLIVRRCYQYLKDFNTWQKSHGQQEAPVQFEAQKVQE